MTTVKDIVERLDMIEGMIAVYRQTLSPLLCRLFDREIDCEGPPLLAGRVVTPEGSWDAVQAEIEERIEALGAERDALMALPIDGLAVPAPRAPLVAEASCPLRSGEAGSSVVLGPHTLLSTSRADQEAA